MEIYLGKLEGEYEFELFFENFLDADVEVNLIMGCGCLTPDVARMKLGGRMHDIVGVKLDVSNKSVGLHRVGITEVRKKSSGERMPNKELRFVFEKI